MKECAGDLWTSLAQYRVVTTNGIITHRGLVMGAGVALQAKQRFPHLPHILGEWVRRNGNIPCLCEQEGIITLPTKTHWKDRSEVELIVNGVISMVKLVDNNHIESVVMTRPGCGNGGLEWSLVRPAIEHLLDDRFTVLGA